MVNEESPRRIFEILNVHEEEETSDEKRTKRRRRVMKNGHESKECLG
jgi:hypothetical protein